MTTRGEKNSKMKIIMSGDFFGADRHRPTGVVLTPWHRHESDKEFRIRRDESEVANHIS